MKFRTQKSAVQSKLIASAIALILSAFLMTGTTYAWFTVSKTPELKKVKVNIEAEKNFEIAMATDKDTRPDEVTDNDEAKGQTAWGNSVTFEDVAQEISIDLPVRLDSSGVQILKYSENGRTNGEFVNANPPDNLTDGIGYYTYKFDDSDKEYHCAAVLGVWLRSNTEGNVTAEMTGLTGGGSLSEDVRVAVKMGEESWAELKESSEADLGHIEAKDEATYTQLIVFINGEGVTAMDMAGTGDSSVSQITIESIKFKNSGVGDGTN